MSIVTEQESCGQALETPDGRRLALRCEGDADVPLAFVVVHGLGEHIGCYGDFINRMVAAGRGVLIYDQHGHGESPGRRGDAPSFDTLIDDIAVALEYAAKHFRGAEIVLLGHSMGGNLVLNHLLDRDHEYVHRAIVTNPMILPPNPPTPPQAFAAWLTGKLIPHLRVSASVEPEQLTRDAGVQNIIADDELTHEKLAVGIGAQLINQGLWLSEHADHLSVKLLVLMGDQDELCDHDTTNELIAKAGKQCQQQVFPGLRHSLLIERDRQQVYNAIHGWLESTSDHALK
ncbi:Phospholipase YtpA [Rubripirellula obstinata]|uniref:Phospholipase YtpA n=1 Tax=Rubripirellula obstinata TaxID=406547 RepID=A0A5B1CLF1_9BACT|nr:alpha/beta hydrolase [Rubripirellula obstinata]KAA1261172.1 Phospholipase YtpA [Rubripirellula obstinata]